MSLASILYPRAAPEAQAERREPPAFFADLFLDQIVAAVTAGRDKYDLAPFFYAPLDDIDVIAYRQEVMRDLGTPDLVQCIAAFVERFEEVRRYRRGSEEAYYRPAKQGLLLEAGAVYCRAVEALAHDLAAASVRSRGLRQYLDDYVSSTALGALKADTEQLTVELRAIRYSLLIHGLSVTVRKYEEQADYSAEIDQTFAKFRQAEVKDYRHKFPEYTGIGHVEAQILDRIARLNPETFARLDDYCRKHHDFIDRVIERFDREVQFYLAYLQHIERLKRAGLPFCYPVVTTATKAVHASDVFDLALANKLIAENGAVVLNDLRLDGKERVLVVSGPNQGGKTTFARAIGQLHYLASLGLPVPGREARLFLCDRLFTHFEREEDATNLRGKLYDDLLLIRRILDAATPRSLVILNEIFSNTALEDAMFLATRVVGTILQLDCLAVCVTFIEEVAVMSEAVVSMVSTVDRHDPAVRTFRLVRRPADERAYAIAIADKWRLTYSSLKERLAS
jgi:DNA mismatch repair ATPase MutS